MDEWKTRAIVFALVFVLGGIIGFAIALRARGGGDSLEGRYREAVTNLDAAKIAQRAIEQRASTLQRDLERATGINRDLRSAVDRAESAARSISAENQRLRDNAGSIRTNIARATLASEGIGDCARDIEEIIGRIEKESGR